MSGAETGVGPLHAPARPTQASALQRPRVGHYCCRTGVEHLLEVFCEGIMCSITGTVRIRWAMKPRQRQQQILAQLHALQSELSVEELAKKFAVSFLTIRRDLDQLEAARVILRTHGGCVLRTSVESAYQNRVALNFELKQAIGRAAAKEVKSGDVILINDGSTAFHLAPHLGHLEKLSVHTNSLAVIPVVARFPGVRLYILGGEYDPEMRFVGGSVTEQALEALQFDIVFLGTDAVDARETAWFRIRTMPASRRSCCGAEGGVFCWPTIPRSVPKLTWFTGV